MGSREYTPHARYCNVYCPRRVRLVRCERFKTATKPRGPPSRRRFAAAAVELMLPPARHPVADVSSVAGKVDIISGATGVDVGTGTAVGVGGGGVGVGGIGVAVAVGGCGTGVAVEGTGVAVGGTGVTVGGFGVAVGGTGVAVGKPMKIKSKDFSDAPL